jgi:hypothetical protein
MRFLSVRSVTVEHLEARPCPRGIEDNQVKSGASAHCVALRSAGAVRGSAVVWSRSRFLVHLLSAQLHLIHIQQIMHSLFAIRVGEGDAEFGKGCDEAIGHQFCDCMHFVQDNILNVVPLQEVLDGILIKAAFAHTRASPCQRCVGHHDDAGRYPFTLAPGLQTGRRAGENQVGREVQPKGLVALFPQPLLLIVDRRHHRSHK